ILDATVEVTHNISKLERTIKKMMPNADLNFSTTDGGLIVSGYTDSVQESDNVKNLASTFIGKNEKLVNLISTAGSDQVTLMVKVAEVSRNELKRFGINLLGAFNVGNFAFQVLQGRTFLDAASNITRFGSDNSLNANYKNGALNSVIDALEKQGL